MDDLNFSREELLSEIDSFIDMYKQTIGPFFMNAAREDGDFFKNIIVAGYRLITLKEWDKEIALEEAETIFNLFHLEAQEFIVPMMSFCEAQFGDNFSIGLIEEVCEKSVRIIERWNDNISPWTVDELQYFCGLSIQSIRNAKNSSGSDHLEFNSDGLVDYETGITWLRSRSSYKGIEDEISSPMMEHFRFNRYSQLDSLNKQRAKFLDISDSFLPNTLLIDNYSLGKNWSLISSSEILEVCKSLKYSPMNFFKTVRGMIEHETYSEFEHLLESKEHALEVDQEASEKTIKELIVSYPDKFQRHPKNKASNKKIGVFYCLESKSCFAHEFNLKNNQHIWVRKRDLDKNFLTEIYSGVYKDSLKIKDTYPELDEKQIRLGAKGRHSGLLVSEELASSELLRLTPKKVSMVKKIFSSIGCMKF